MGSSDSLSETDSSSDESLSVWLEFFWSGFFGFKRLDRITTPSGWASKTFWRQDYCCLAYSRERKCIISVLCLPWMEKTSIIMKMKKRVVFEAMNPSRSQKQVTSPLFESEKAALVLKIWPTTTNGKVTNSYIFQLVVTTMNACKEII